VPEQPTATDPLTTGRVRSTVAGPAVGTGGDPTLADSAGGDPPGAAGGDVSGAAGRDPTGGDPKVADAGWRPSLLFGLWIWLGGLAACAAVTAVAWLPFEHIRDAPRNLSEAIQTWHRWDTTWYVIIAQLGYRFDPRSAAFFPLYPLLVRAADPVVPGDAFLAALAVSALAGYAALVMVHRLVSDLLGGAVGRRTTFYLLAFPTGFFLLAAYNESLFIALAVGSMYAMRRQRWWLAGLLAGLASATRVAGVLLVIVFAYEYLRQRGFALGRVRPAALWIALAPAGLVGYAGYCWAVFDDPLFFQKQQAVWFRDGFTAPWTPMIQAARLIADDPVLLSPTAIRNLINLLTTVGVLVLLGLALSGRWRLGPASGYLVLFAGLDIMLPLLSGVNSDYPLSGMWRFALECLPVFMVLARMGRSPTFDRLFLMLALPVQGVMILTFVQNQFVA
jgi:Mannosyltransferase (PIG-V)